MKSRQNVALLFLIPVLMFGFGYLMVPIYNVFCDLTGLNGKTGRIAASEAEQLQTDEDRQVRVEFTATLNEDAQWNFGPVVSSMMVNPGKPYKTSFTAENRLGYAKVGQAIPSLAPGKAASYFNKTECFCFQQQKFDANETRDMPLVFVVDPDLPKDITTVTLSYTFFDVSQSAQVTDDQASFN